jgi:beta-glucosidase
MRGVVKAAPNVPLLDLGWLRPDGEYTHFDWEVYPAGIRDVLLRVQRDYQPKAIYITENGAAFLDQPGPDGRVDDPQRRSYLERHLAACREAIQGGAKLKGYFTWSLIDNFEWAEGYDKRFGLVRVDFDTQRRTVKASGEWYGKLARGEL